MTMSKNALLEMKKMMEVWIDYRGGMGNRIDGFAVLNRINNELKEYDAINNLIEELNTTYNKPTK